MRMLTVSDAALPGGGRYWATRVLTRPQDRIRGGRGTVRAARMATGSGSLAYTLSGIS